MHWKVRANLLRMLAATPGGHPIYLALQRQFGRFRNAAYIRGKLKRQAMLAQLAVDHGVKLDGARVMEVGTGWVPALAFGFYLCGAERVWAFDLNRFVLTESLRATLDEAGNFERNSAIWSECVDKTALRDRMQPIAQLSGTFESLSELGIVYVAPGDARATNLPSNSIDIHCSTNTFEHIPREDLLSILIEARRVLKPDGIAVHYVDPTDHFAHADKTQSPVRFLHFDERMIEQYYRNRYTYQNLMFDDDYRALFDEAGLDIVDARFKIDERSLSALRGLAPQLKRFQNRDIEELSRRNLIYVTRKRA